MASTTGQATRRYLEAIDQRQPGPVDWTLAPPRSKQYRDTTRTALPTTGPDAWRGDLLRGLLGLTRMSWKHPTNAAGRAISGLRSVEVSRPVPSGGALYPIEAYLADDMAVHHYDTVHHALETVRDGDHRNAFPATAAADAAVILSAVFWRNGFKYRDFAYRLACQETGALCAQALVLAESLGLNASIHLDFDGERADSLLGLDSTAEGTLAILTFSLGTGHAPRRSAGVPSNGQDVAQPTDPPISITRSLPRLAELHAATRTPCAPPSSRSRQAPTPGEPAISLPQVADLDLARGIPHRASPLNGYSRRPLTTTELAQILAAARPGAQTTTDLHVLVWNVTDMPAGAYRYDRDWRALTGGGPPAIEAGPLRANTRHALCGAAAALVPVGAPLIEAAERGDLAYRLQQTETGMVAHRAALAAAALGLAGRIHSDGTNPTTDAVLGLADTPRRSLSLLLVGHPYPSGPTLMCRSDRGVTAPTVHNSKE
ncbi:SagB family peptide dehydrogenase [Spirillospora sp. NPDC052269]